MSEALIENKSIDSKNPDVISAVPSYTAKVEPDIKFKPEPHLKSEVFFCVVPFCSSYLSVFLKGVSC